MGQSNSSNKGSQSSDQSELQNRKKKSLNKRKKTKESFRRHSLLNLFNSNHNLPNNSKDSTSTNKLKLNKSEVNINNIIDKKINSDSDISNNRFDSNTTINSVSSNNLIKNRILENLKSRESKSLSPSTTRKALPPVSLAIPSHLINARKMVLKPKTNQIYDDYFISKQVLGLGISGKVLSCTCKRTQTKYALKTLRDSVKAKREIDLHWRACQGCPYIVQIVDVYENLINSQKVLLVVMECMNGGELFAKISERSTPFTEQEVAKIMHQICSAVKHLHSMSIAHRDLKPENLLLTGSDEKAIIKLTDFGFAKEVNLGLVTPCYTPYYVAPEVLGSVKYDISCDIWSLGVIMYILCCGYPPFYSTHGQPISPGMKRRIKAGEYAFPENEWSKVSNEAKSLIHGMLETIPEKRITIDDIVKSKWISHYYTVPQTPLPSLDILREDIDNWAEVQQNMGMALNDMRINYDDTLKIKNLPEANNSLFEKRMEKRKKKMNPPAAPVGFNNLNDQIIIENYSRETTVVSMKSVTPSNSRPSSPDFKL